MLLSFLLYGRTTLSGVCKPCCYSLYCEAKYLQVFLLRNHGGVYNFHRMRIVTGRVRLAVQIGSLTSVSLPKGQLWLQYHQCEK